MNPRENKFAIIVGTLFGVLALFYVVKLVFIDPSHDAQAAYVSRLNREKKLQKLIRTEKGLSQAWLGDAVRTFSFDSAEAQELLGADLKNIALRHGFDSANFKPRTGKKIGSRTKITTVAYGVSAVGPYERAVEFLRDIYQTPYLCQITRLTITPLGPKVGRNIVKLAFTVETPVLPRIARADIKRASGATTMPAEGLASLPPYRKDLPEEGRYLVLSERNIFRSFVPAPTNLVMVDNQDYKTVALEVKFFWEGKLRKQLYETVAGKSQKPVSEKGDVVEITGSYADGEAFGPKRFDFNQQKNWVYQVATHSPEPPAKVVTLAVNNQDSHEVLLDVVITTKDNKQIRPPTMLIEPGKVQDVGQWEAKQVQVTARYKSQKPAQGGTYKPAAGKQVLTIPVEPAVAVAAAGGPASPVDPAPDPRYTVSGLWTYRGAQEMIVSGPNERKIITAGQEGAVDSGTLLAVHPLGGVVKMPSGHFYIYPLGKSFTDRVPLKVREESQLAAAIDAWTRQ